jgi:outer membrane protein TolC
MRAALYWTAVAVLLLPGGGLAGQEALELREAARLALAAHPAALAARASVEGARGATAEARAATLPWLSIDGLAVRHQEPMVVAPLHGFDPLQPPVFERTLVQGSVSAGYTLFDGGTRGARVARARAREAGTEAGRRAADAQLMLATAGAFLDVLGSRELARAHASRVASLGEETQRAGRLHAEGRVARVAVLRAEAALALAEAERIAGEARRDAAERQLARLIGWEYERVTAAALPAPLRRRSRRSRRRSPPQQAARRRSSVRAHRCKPRWPADVRRGPRGCPACRQRRASRSSAARPALSRASGRRACSSPTRSSRAGSAVARSCGHRPTCVTPSRSSVSPT